MGIVSTGGMFEFRGVVSLGGVVIVEVFGESRGYV